MNSLASPVKEVVKKMEPVPAIAPPTIESDGSISQELLKWGSGLVAGIQDGMGVERRAGNVTVPRGLKEARERVGHWWAGERVDRVADGVLSVERRELDSLIVDGTCFLLSHPLRPLHLPSPPSVPAPVPVLYRHELTDFIPGMNVGHYPRLAAVLSHLVCKSLTEDSYGVVQRDIPRILEAFLAFLSAVEEYQVELQGLLPPPTPEDADVLERERAEMKREQVERAGLAIGVVGDGESSSVLLSSFELSCGSLTEVVVVCVVRTVALKEGVIRIVRTFGGRLSAFKFPMGTARKLQGFVDYCA